MSDDKNMISDEAVEAAAKVALENSSIRSLWHNAVPEWRGAYRDSLIAALEAAAPHLIADGYADVFDEGVEAGQGKRPRPNLYRSQA